MKTILLSILLGSCMLPTLQAQDNYVSKVWVADQGDGTYKNPVLYADYSDPDVIRVGEDYYLTSSSFGCLPGLQVLQIQLLNMGIVYGLLASVIITVSSTSFGVTPTKAFLW